MKIVQDNFEFNPTLVQVFDRLNYMTERMQELEKEPYKNYFEETGKIDLTKVINHSIKIKKAM